MRFWKWLRDEATDERILRLDGAISDETWLGDEVTPKQFREELNAGQGDIVIWINSPGGDVFAASEIYNMLKDYRGGKVTVKIDSIAGSAASMVAMAGDEVLISPTGQLFLHNPKTAAIGNTDEFTAAIKFLEEIKESLITAYELKTKLPRETISRLMDEETWLNAKKAVELGFADSIMFTQKQEEISAQMFSQRRATNSLTAAFKKKFPETERRVAVAKLRNRLDEVAHKPLPARKPISVNMTPPQLQGQFKSGLRRGNANAQIGRTKART